jgi:peptide/nickel transport system substrate-binding protein
LVAIYWWQRPAPSPAPLSEPHAAPRRGGQLVASIRGEPRSFNRYVAREQTTDLLAILTQGRLVRINRATFEIEPWLAERWQSDADGRTHTLFLRHDVRWSDGTPFTAADVLFSFEAAFDGKPPSVLASGLTVGGQPIHVTAPDDHTVVVTFATTSGPDCGCSTTCRSIPGTSCCRR